MLRSARIPLAILSGALLILIFPSFKIGWLAWVSLVPLMIAISGLKKFDAFKLSYLTGTIYFAGVMPWIFTVLTQYGHIWAPISLALTALLIFYLALFIGFFGWFVALFGKGPESLLVSAPIFATLEWIRSHFLTGLPWALLAHSQSDYPAVIQIASLSGTSGVTFLIVLVNSAVAYGILNRHNKAKAFALPAVALFVCLLNFGWGTYRINQIERSPGDNFKASVVQGNIDQGRKWNPAFREEVISSYYDMTIKEAAKKPDLIVWPETAMPFHFDWDAAPTARLLNLSKDISTPIVFGGMGVEKAKNGTGYIYANRSFAISPQGKLGHYDKMHLVPFGEYVPLKKLLFFVNRLTDAAPGGIIEGKTANPIPIAGIPVGMQICYEIKFPGPTREFVKNGARLIVNITNDAWFGRSGASEQHMASLPFRAVENGVPLIRSANTGVSGFVTAAGKMFGTTSLFERVSTSGEIKVPKNSGTFYTRYGDVFGFLCAAASIIALWNFRKAKKLS